MPESLKAVFARRLRQERVAARVSQAELARRISERLGIVVDGSAITRIENQGRSFKLEEAVAAAQALGVPLAVLVSGKSPTEARVDELRRGLELQQNRAAEAEAEFRQAQAAMVAIEQEIDQIEADGG
ncbi:helix-turn-helix transcriptional regulator [Zhihengliuella sp.]|uniref:helix-turn-helix domain-containing protein n=1 Tax=Zhihengliuella sp. TaxID=1954483 RepID=UPI00281146E2|nr:helix-turn-helix transcriptional regulator [Zhihengliuella sp.]